MKTNADPVQPSLKYIFALSLGIFMIITAVAGCRSKQPEFIIEEPKSEPTTIEVRFKASVQMNPDRNGRASPLVARLYLLDAIADFNHAEFFSLYDKDRELLSNEIILREEFRLTPREERLFTRVIKPERVPGQNLFLGVIAAYRQIDKSHWRAWTAIPTEQTTEVTVHLKRLAVSLEQIQAKKEPPSDPNEPKAKSR